MSKNLLWKIVSLVFNPLLIPLWCVVLYYLLTPRIFFPLEAFYSAAVVAVATIALPLPVMGLLKVSGKIESISLHHTYERRLPLLLLVVLIACALKFYLIGRVSPAVPLALAGAAISIAVAYLTLWADKISLHAMGMAGLVCLLAMLMIKWNAPLNLALLVVIPAVVCYDLVVIARMELGRHNARQIVLGTLTGALPQILLFSFLY